jgi:hypothetical protein
VDEQPLIFALPVAYFRDALGVSYETGRDLLRRNVLVPDAVLDDGRPLFLLSPESIEKARRRIHAHRGRVLRVRHNLSIAHLCQKTAIP